MTIRHEIITPAVAKNASRFITNALNEEEKMAKQKPFIIRTPFPTIEEYAKKYKLTKKRLKQNEEIMNEIYKKKKLQKTRKKNKKIKK